MESVWFSWPFGCFCRGYGALPDFLFLFPFPCLADHKKRDWPPHKYCFWVGNQKAECGINKQLPVHNNREPMNSNVFLALSRLMMYSFH